LPHANNIMNKNTSRIAARVLLTLVLAVSLCGIMIQAQIPNEVVLHSFSGASTHDGSSPYGGLVLGADGVFYGATWSGGTNAAGTVFRINADGSGYAVLRSFTWSPDGEGPCGSLIQGSDGAFYGETQFGGTSNQGSVFMINTNGTVYKELYSFTNTPDGANPDGSLVQGGDGALYGTTAYGGITNAGTVFKISTDGSGYSVLHSFTNTPDGSNPLTGLTLGMDGALYGVSGGGVNLVGTVFTIKTNGAGYSVIHNFTGYYGGLSPEAALIQGGDGTLYGTTVGGGTNGCGTVFKVSTNGSSFTLLHTFSNSPDGAYPYGGLMLASDGALYGTTSSGGNTNAGTLFKVNPDGSGYSVLYHFTGTNGDGANSHASLVGKAAGVFYGTTLNQGTHGFGTIFRFALSPTLELVGSKPAALQGTVTGFSDQSCLIQTSTNLIDWGELTHLVLTNGIGQFTDSAATNGSRRFYRAVVQ
jgi:uncharacterized repeat protein (TIGR03803 family)